MRALSILAALLLVAAAPRLHAQGLPAADPVRPGLTEDATVLEPSQAKVEAGYSCRARSAAPPLRAATRSLSS